jgi:S1-C subfamily serine protease
MNWENVVVKINVKFNEIDFNSPLNTRNIMSSSGTGFFIKSNLILTCYHVVKNAVNIEITYQQTTQINGSIKYINML